MYRLAIIDDEFATRQGLRSMLDWKKLDIEIVGEAEDGFAGKALVQRQRPDILICDVRMPRLDGIALVAQLRPLFPDLQIIFLSGHSEKAYLRSAIRFGAIDYLDKPVLREELRAVVEKAKERVQDSRGNQPLRTFQWYIAQLFAGQAAHTALPQGLPVDFDRPYQLAVFAFGFPEREGRNRDLMAEQQLEPSARLWQELFQGKGLLHALGAQYVGYGNPAPGFSPAQAARAFAQASPQLWAHTALCFSTPHTGVHSLAAAYRQAQEANRSFFSGFGRCYLQDPRLEPDQYGAQAAAIDKICRQVQERSFSRAAEILESYLTVVKRCRVADSEAIRKDLARLSVFLAKEYHPQDEAYAYAVLEHIKFRCLCLDEIRAYVQDLLGSLISSFDSLSTKGRVIYDVDRYIQDHYAQEISIADIARHVYLTPTYLCYLYKKNTGKTLNASLTEVKMEKAKELLADHSLKLSDIAGMLGYSSPSYFTRAFLKHFGLSPTAYRNQRL